MSENDKNDMLLSDFQVIDFAESLRCKENV